MCMRAGGPHQPAPPPTAISYSIQHACVCVCVQAGSTSRPPLREPQPPAAAPGIVDSSCGSWEVVSAVRPQRPAPRSWAALRVRGKMMPLIKEAGRMNRLKHSMP